MRGRAAEALARLALVVLSPLVVFGALELVALAFGVAPHAGQKTYEARRTLELCRWRARDVEERCGPRRAEGRRGVYVFGGSSVAGHPFGEKRTISFYLQQRLDSAYPGAYAVFNYGVPCKDSGFVSACARRALEGHPAFVVLYTGHNDFGGNLGPHPRRALLLRENPWLLELRHALAHTRLFSLATPGAVGELDYPLTRPDPDWDLAGAMQVVLDDFERNLAAVFAAARERGVPVLAVTVVGNLFEFPFPRERWDLALAKARSAQPAPRWLAEFARGIELDRAGERSAAYDAFVRSRDLYYPSSRAATTLNERLRALVARHPDVALVDFERTLETIGRRDGLGCEWFGGEGWCDGVHPNPRANAAIADEIFRGIEARLAGGA